MKEVFYIIGIVCVVSVLGDFAHGAYSGYVGRDAMPWAGLSWSYGYGLFGGGQ